MAPVLHFFDFFQTCGPADLLTRPHLYKLVTCPTLRIFFQWIFFLFFAISTIFRPTGGHLCAVFDFSQTPEPVSFPMSHLDVQFGCIYRAQDHLSVTQAALTHIFPRISSKKTSCIIDLWNFHQKHENREKISKNIRRAHTEEREWRRSLLCDLCVGRWFSD